MFASLILITIYEGWNKKMKIDILKSSFFHFVLNCIFKWATIETIEILIQQLEGGLKVQTILVHTIIVERETNKIVVIEIAKILNKTPNYSKQLIVQLNRSFYIFSKVNNFTITIVDLFYVLKPSFENNSKSSITEKK